MHLDSQEHNFFILTTKSDHTANLAGTWRLYNVGSTSMKRHDDVVLASCVRWECTGWFESSLGAYVRTYIFWLWGVFYFWDKLWSGKPRKTTPTKSFVPFCRTAVYSKRKTRVPHSGAKFARVAFYKGSPSIWLDKGIRYVDFHKSTLMLPLLPVMSRRRMSETNKWKGSN